VLWTIVTAPIATIAISTVVRNDISGSLLQGSLYHMD
jgi:hypothetical protein